VNSVDIYPTASPVEQAEDAKRRRDIGGEIAAVMEGDRALRSAPWYPARAGDRLTIVYEADSHAPAWYETYAVDSSADGLTLRLVDRTPGEEYGRMAGFFAGPDEFGDDPLTTPWMEAGPARLIIARDRVTVHDGPRLTGASAGDAVVHFDGGLSVTLHGATLVDLGPNYYGARYTQLGGWIDPKAPAPFVSAAIVRAELPGRPPFAVEHVSLDQSNAGMPEDYLKVQWPTGRETPC
jgi:hypothetical protein